MITPPEVIAFLERIASSEAQGSPEVDGHRLPVSVLDYAEQHGLIKRSEGSWQDDSDYCSLTNKGRTLLGLPAVPNFAERLRSLVRRFMPA